MGPIYKLIFQCKMENQNIDGNTM